MVGNAKYRCLRRVGTGCLVPFISAFWLPIFIFVSESGGLHWRRQPQPFSLRFRRCRCLDEYG